MKSRVPDFIRSRTFRFVLRLVERSLAAIGLVTIIYLIGFDYSRMVSGSMAPTLHGEDWREGDRVLSERFTYWFRSPRRWEVIAYQHSNGNRIMKRVVGLPGETLAMRRDGTILINGHAISVPADVPPLRHAYVPIGKLFDGKSIACETGYFVLGDETLDSDDSRFNPPVQPGQILGRAWLTLGPAGRRGVVR